MEPNFQCATAKEFYQVDNFLQIKLQTLMKSDILLLLIVL